VTVPSTPNISWRENRVNVCLLPSEGATLRWTFCASSIAATLKAFIEFRPRFVAFSPAFVDLRDRQ